MRVKRLIALERRQIALECDRGHHFWMLSESRARSLGPITRWPQDEISALTTFGQRLEAARLAKGLSQSELARRAKCRPSMINMIERGYINKAGKSVHIKDCKSALAFRLSDAVEVSARWLVWASGPVGKWEPLSPEEREILTHYRELPNGLKESARAVLLGLRQAGPPSRSLPFQPPKK